MLKFKLFFAFMLLGLFVKAQETGTFTDSRDGHVYKTVKIGNQWWMAENLAYKPSSGNYWAYDNNSSNVAKYGYLYDWETAKKVCPTGWHLPSDAEWTTLINYLGGESVAGGKMKSTIGWKYDADVNASNSSGFSALPGGYRFYFVGSFLSIGEYGGWWSSTPNGDERAWLRNLYYYYGEVYRNDYTRTNGVSVRCVKD